MKQTCILCAKLFSRKKEEIQSDLCDECLDKRIRKTKMADFKKAWEKTSKSEGGYVNNSVDKGKETYRGIASAFHPKWEGWEIVRKTITDLGIVDTLDAPKATRGKIDKALSAIPELDEMVQRFYKKEFWDKLNLDNEPAQIIADKIFDVAVNMGVGAAKKMMTEMKGEQHA